MKNVVLKIFVWRLLLFLPIFFAILWLPLQKNFLGGGMTNYNLNPYFWSFANFDGEHYLAIATRGYQPLEYFFFPLYSLMVRFVTQIFTYQLASFVFSGLLLSFLFFIMGVVGLKKLLEIDYSSEITNKTILLLLVFPTSFYFASLYTESLFLMLVVWSFYFARKESWFLASILGGFAAATRLVGIVMLPALFFELWILSKGKNTKYFILNTLYLLLIPLGLLGYMLFLKQQTGDPLEFFHNVAIFGEQRSSYLVVLPQVFYRYIFKILPFVGPSNWMVMATTYLEFFSGIAFLILSFFTFSKTRFSYAIFSFLAYLIPTLAGSFSSMPRYVLILFPCFIVMAIYFEKKSRLFNLFIVTSTLFLFVFEALFVRGYWVS